MNEPQPDLTLLKPRDDFYSTVHPGPSDALLVVEVSESSLRYDRQIKLALYARFVIPEVWIVDLIDRRLRVFRVPVDGRYLEESTSTAPGSIRLAALDADVDVSGLLSLP